MRVYFESALVPVYVPEKLTATATDRLTTADTIYVSWLTKTEMASALALKARIGQLDSGTVHRVLDVFHRHLESGAFQVLPIRQEIFGLATRWIEQLETPLRTLDAFHLACAHHLDLTLITADLALARSADHLGVPCERLPSQCHLENP